MSKLDQLLDAFGHESAVGCEFDNRERIADARKAIIDHVDAATRKVTRKDVIESPVAKVGFR